MLRYILFLLSGALCLLAPPIEAQAQKARPKYAWAIPDDSVNALGITGFFVDDSSRYQGIYYPSNFPGMPAGEIKNIYLRFCGNNNNPSTYKEIKSLRIRMANTALTIFGFTDSVHYPFITMPAPVVDKLHFAMPDPIRIYDWVRIPLTEGSFYYTGTQNFIVQLDIQAQYKLSLAFTYTHQSYPDIRFLLSSPRDSINIGYGERRILDLGFDIATVSVNDAGNFASFGLFPNPATGGRFQVSFDANRPVREASVIVTNAAGREAYCKTYLGVGRSFFKEVDMRGAAKGMYFVQVLADGERITRRVMIE